MLTWRGRPRQAAPRTPAPGAPHRALRHGRAARHTSLRPPKLSSSAPQHAGRTPRAPSAEGGIVVTIHEAPAARESAGAAPRRPGVSRLTSTSSKAARTSDHRRPDGSRFLRRGDFTSAPSSSGARFRNRFLPPDSLRPSRPRVFDSQDATRTTTGSRRAGGGLRLSTSRFGAVHHSARRLDQSTPASAQPAADSTHGPPNGSPVRGPARPAADARAARMSEFLAACFGADPLRHSAGRVR